METNALAGADTVTLPAGTYTLTIQGAAAGATTGDLNVSGTLTITGAGSGTSQVVADFPATGGPTDRVFRVEAGGSLTMTGLAISGGWTSNDGGGVFSRGDLTLSGVRLASNIAEALGGGIYAAAGATRLTNVTVTGNEGARGSGIYLAAGTLVMTGGSIRGGYSFDTLAAGLHSAGTATLTGVSIADNSGEFDAPGVYNQGTLTLKGGQVARNGTNGIHGKGAAGGIQNYGRLTVTGSKILDNRTQCEDSCADYGGGVGNFGTLTMTNVVVQGNIAYHSGGGIDNAAGATMALTRVSVLGNQGRNNAGGGIANHGSATLTDVVIADNLNKTDGGGLFNDGQLTGRKVSIYRNQAGYLDRPVPKRGGGIFNAGGLTLTNVTVYRNSAVEGGGALYNNVADSAQVVRLTNVTIAANTTVTGATLTNRTAPQLSNTIVAAGGTACVGSVSSLGGNLATDASCGLGAAGDQVTASPKLASGLAKSNGSYTPVLALLAGSPAIDRAIGPGCPAKDQRNIARPIDGNGDGRAVCDTGSFEYKP